MSIQGLEVVQLTNHYRVTRVGGRLWYHRDAWVRTPEGVLEMASIRTDLLGEA